MDNIRVAEQALENSGSVGGSVPYQLTSYISSYVPSTLKRQLPEWASVHLPYTSDRIITSTFDTVWIDDQRHSVLVLTYHNGFQIWNVADTSNIYEIVSKREGAIKQVKCLQPPQFEDESHRLHPLRPLVAVLSADPSPAVFSRNTVKLFSLRTSDYVYQLLFKGDVIALGSSRRIFLVMLKEQVYGFDATTLASVFQLKCFPNPDAALAIAALSTRWVAFQGTTLPAPHAPPPQAAAPPAPDHADPAANSTFMSLASGLYSIGKKKVAGYFAADPTERVQGVVHVFDFVDKRLIAAFQASHLPLSHLAFDHTGTLLATASEDGKNFNIYRISPCSDPRLAATHLYELVRGYTNATVCNMSFSLDSRWLAVSSTKGTTHLYAIHPQGGPVSAMTHLTGLPSSTSSWSWTTAPSKPTVLQVMARVRQPVLNDDDQGSRFPQHVLHIQPSVATLLAPATGRQVNLLVATQPGILVLYRLEYFNSAQMKEATNGLVLSAEAVGQWNVCRNMDWPELRVNVMKFPGFLKKEEPASGARQKWLQHVELVSFDPDHKPFWMSRIFLLHTLSMPPPVGEEERICFERRESVEVQINGAKSTELEHFAPQPAVNAHPMLVQNLEGDVDCGGPLSALQMAKQQPL